MRSADLRARLTRVAELGERTFAFRSVDGVGISWRSLVPATVVLTILLVASWNAGRGSAQLEGQRLSSEIDFLTQKITSGQLTLARERKKTNELEQALESSGKNADVTLVAQLHRQLLQAQAEANQYKTILKREQQKQTENGGLLDALSSPGAHLLAMKGAEAAMDSTAYALLAENGRLLLIASRLPKLAGDRQFQLWLFRKQEPKIVSAGVFDADEKNRALMDFDDRSALADLVLLEITDEPRGGSSEPSGAKLLETGIPDKTE